jgi:hypothetical protein
MQDKDIAETKSIICGMICGSCVMRVIIATTCSRSAALMEIVSGCAVKLHTTAPAKNYRNRLKGCSVQLSGRC